MLKLFRFMCAVAVITAGMATAARAEAVVQVTLIGKAGAVDFSKSLNFGMGTHGDMKKALMGVNVYP
jgi:hypothetical protein